MVWRQKATFKEEFLTSGFNKEEEDTVSKVQDPKMYALV